MTKINTFLLWEVIQEYARARSIKDHKCDIATSVEEEKELEKHFLKEQQHLADKIGEWTGWQPVLIKETSKTTEWEIKRYEIN